MSYLDNIKDVYDHLAKGKALDAFEKYYGEDVVMVLEDGTAVEGKDKNRDREMEFFASVESFNGLDVKSITANEGDGSTTVECVMDVTFTGGNRMNVEQVAVQQWEGDKIVRERFYATQNN